MNPSNLLKNHLRIKDDILGRDYELSLVLVDEAKSKELNKKYRHKDKPANVLAFALEKNEGEIFLTPSIIKKDELIFMFIHGLLHLKGLKHGIIMEKEEKKFLAKWQEISSPESTLERRPSGSS